MGASAQGLRHHEILATMSRAFGLLKRTGVSAMPWRGNDVSRMWTDVIGLSGSDVIALSEPPAVAMRTRHRSG